MPMRNFSILLLSAALTWAADKKPPVAQAASSQIAITATLYEGQEAVRQALGSGLGAGFIVVKVELAPKAGKTIAVSRDDFLLRSYNDGERCQPFAPTEIAGRGGLELSSNRRATVMAENPGPVWGGIPGTGMPRRLPGSGGQIGNGSASGGTETTVDSGGKDKEDPLLAVLKSKVLQEKETSTPVSGLLYFSLEGKHKTKDLALQYAGPAGKLTLRFH